MRRVAVRITIFLTLELMFSEVVISFILRKRLVRGVNEFILHLSNLLLVNGDVLGSEDWSFDEDEALIVDESSEEPDERFLELVVGLG